MADQEGTFFALGDALHNSEDSRDFGPVPVERIIGRVLQIVASLAAPEGEGGGEITDGFSGRQFAASRATRLASRAAR